MTNDKPVKFLIGCAVWAYKGWVGELYPSGTRTAEFLSLYSRRFTTVEGNTTFYAIPNQETVTRWATETPPGFEFCLKLPRDITHQGLLQPYIPAALQFLEGMRPLGKRLGPIFAQLPPSYAPILIEDLTTFLEAWPRTVAPLALEVRHPDWFKEPHASNLTALLEKLNVGRVLLDSRPIYTGDDDPQLNSERRKPKLPVQFSVTAPFTLIRFISHPNLPVNQPFMEEWVTQIQQWLQAGVQIYFFVHCPIEERSPSTARHFQNLLEQNGVAVPPLPWNNLDRPPNQLSLWDL
ncbi:MULTISPECIES: DUF72 domain-containing protein [unclassified Tolypothrix]|uniref:DUF72 domain-containing protein n=1 Tax=unclassified Tolypothrix TaxID=2649714 RepID=UPI0005EAA3B3|nr:MULTISPECIES: DUF72 domain-containing protein [unclassified Tolypothrix]BAY89025.1 hypothetical protein NIES3275_10280 [Microchaete diplosiphon NIES-3275]EKF06175.1 hypothetical protein FDUTEX481_00112 [Tolypothrix sp. PCC 7601]MBE9080793.1 DUF72 domain-containing protein [Tolypothrix sp. LEGE 11397]UYD29654.1 DUF72 domain-containing protein [Tolypothrix sp. PCC 7712]UYD34430.1 DUF72 domain-containing protein [Tolypothrix sp. PCC 7601]